MAYTPNYKPSSGATTIRTDPVSIPINGKSIAGYLTTFSDGTSKWIYQGDIGLSSNYDYSTLTGLKDTKGNWTWQGTTTNSIPSLSSRVGLTVDQIKNELYNKPQLQNTLNGLRVQQIGGISEAQKIDPTIPGTVGTASNPNAPLQGGSGSTSPTYSEIQVGEKSGLELKTAFPLQEMKAILGNDIVYPTELRGNGQDFIKFTMIEYGSRPFQSPPLNSNTTSFKIGTRDLKSTGTSVYLPIQPSINDQNDIGWGEEKMTVFQSVLANIATKGSAEVLGSELDKVGEIFGNGEYEKIMRRFLGGMAVGINPIARTDGLVLNPNLELLFSGPS